MHLHFWRRSPEQLCSSFHGAKSKQIPKLRNKTNLTSEWSKGDFVGLLSLRLFRIKRNLHRVSAMEKMKAWVGSTAENQAVPVSTVPVAEHQVKWLNI